ncbi:MAG: hypothetical protein WC729_06445 [Sphingomonas sp.]|jgi:hypothetical protein|uniref:hypothetical protein n=1 Tax=Sphingomonas sp. TaxID=28214 RepID=UPI00356337E4
MIKVYPDSFLPNALIIGIVFVTLAIAAFSTMRWNWKALPLVLLGGLITPILVPVVAMIVSYCIDMHKGEAGSFSFHLEELIFFVGLPSALIGFGGVLAVRRFRSPIR